MVRSTDQSNPIIKPLVEQIIRTGQMSHEQYALLAEAILADCRMSDEDRRQINRVFDSIQIGQLKLVD